MEDDRYELNLDWYRDTLRWQTAFREVEVERRTPVSTTRWMKRGMLAILGKTETDHARTTKLQMDVALSRIARGKQSGEGLTVQDLVQLVGQMRVECPMEEYASGRWIHAP